MQFTCLCTILTQLGYNTQDTKIHNKIVENFIFYPIKSYENKGVISQYIKYNALITAKVALLSECIFYSDSTANPISNKCAKILGTLTEISPLSFICTWAVKGSGQRKMVNFRSSSYTFGKFSADDL